MKKKLIFRLSYRNLILVSILSLPIIAVTDKYWRKVDLDTVALVANTFDKFNLILDSVSKYKHLELDKKKLIGKVMLLEAKVNSLQADVKENIALKKLLASSSKLSGSFNVANVSEWFNNTIIINKGASDMVFLGQAVLDGAGIIGKVTEVGKNSSKIKLITSAEVSIPVKSQNNIFGFAHGLGAEVIMDNLAASANIAIGDTISTSGIAGFYPESYPFAKVSKITTDANGKKKAILIPTAKLSNIAEVLLYWNNK